VERRCVFICASSAFANIDCVVVIGYSVMGASSRARERGGEGWGRVEDLVVFEGTSHRLFDQKFVHEIFLLQIHDNDLR